MPVRFPATVPKHLQTANIINYKTDENHDLPLRTYNIMKESKHKIIHSTSFNADNSLMAIATNVGFKIYSTSPTSLKQERDFGAPIQICELIDRSNLMGLVGFKETPFAPPHKLAIFDDSIPLLYLRRAEGYF